MAASTGRTGAPLKRGTLRQELQAFTRTHGTKTVPHGLRKNAVNALLEAGGTIAEVASITGQTFAIVEHYAKRMNSKAMGSAVILKLENTRATGKQS